MHIVFLSYDYTPVFDQPLDWLYRIRAYTGILEALSQYATVTSIERIDYEGTLLQEGVDYHFLNATRRELRFPWKLHRYVCTLKPDIVFVHGLHFPFQILQLRMQLPHGVRIIAQHHAERPGGRIRRFLQQMADPFIDAYLFTALEMGYGIGGARPRHTGSPRR